MKATITTASTGASFPVTDPGSHWQNQAWHLYASGTWGASGSLIFEVSPDPPVVADASSRWFTQSGWTLATAGNVWFQARFRKARFRFTGGDGTTNVVAEVV